MRGRSALVTAAFAVVGAAYVLALTVGSYFTTDDHVFFAQAHEQSFGLHFLTEPIFDHFSPWHRGLDYIVARTTDQAWWLALVISTSWYLAAVAAFAALIRRLVGTHPAGMLALLAFALSAALVEATQWWALGAQFYPQLVFSLLTLVAALEWQRSRRRRALVLAVLCFALALCGFIKALLTIPLLLLVLYARPGPEAPRPRAAWRTDRALWAALAVLSVAYLVVISGDRYYRFIASDPGAGAGLWIKYAVAAWGEGVAPLVLGGVPAADLSLGKLLVVLLANGAIVALVIATVRSRRACAWTWAAAGAAVVAGVLMSGAARLGTIGIERIVLDPRFQVESAVAVLLAAAMTAAATWPRLTMRAPGRERVVLAVAAVLIVAVAVDGGLRRERDFNGSRHRAYFDTFARTLADAGAVDVLDGQIAGEIVDPSIYPYNVLSAVLPLREPAVDVGTGVGPPAYIDGTGRVTPVTLEPFATPLEGGCGPLEFAVDAPESTSALVLSLRRADASRTVDVVVTADSGLRGTQYVAGFPLPPVIRTTIRMRPGRSGLRMIAGFGRVQSLGVATTTGSPLCVEDARLARFPLPR